jgi:hypothetical protein
MKDILTWLQAWFLSQCNDTWEHSYGIKIDTLDNPGWEVVIDLAGTSCDSKTMDAIAIHRTSLRVIAVLKI